MKRPQSSKGRCDVSSGTEILRRVNGLVSTSPSSAIHPHPGPQCSQPHGQRSHRARDHEQHRADDHPCRHHHLARHHGGAADRAKHHRGRRAATDRRAGTAVDHHATGPEPGPDRRAGDQWRKRERLCGTDVRSAAARRFGLLIEPADAQADIARTTIYFAPDSPNGPPK